MEVRERRKEPTLKEKLQEHYRNKPNFKPDKKRANQLGQNFFWGMTITLFFESQFVLIPHLYGDDLLKMFLVIALVWFTLFESAINWMGTYFAENSLVQPGDREKYFPGSVETPPGWVNCSICQVDAPPRSHHCPLCSKCVLKRDHHCFFTGTCVGFYNQRFFVLFCIYMIWGNAFALFLQLSYLNESIPLFSSEAVTYLPLIAFFKLIFGQITFGSFFLISHACFCILCLIAAIFFLCWQLLIISQGVTSYEAWKQIRSYQRSCAENFRSVFGSFKWIPLQFLFPFKVDQDGNGYQWDVRNRRVKGQ